MLMLPHKFRWGKQQHLEQGRSSNSLLSTAISAPILPIEPQDHACIIHRSPCGWVDADLVVLWVESDQKWDLKVGFELRPCLKFCHLPYLG